MLAAPCFNWVKPNDFSSIMLHGLKAVHDRLPRDLPHSLSQTHVFGESNWMEGSARGWSWHSRKREAAPALSPVMQSACFLFSLDISSLVLVGVELHHLCSVLIPSLVRFLFISSSLPLSVSYYEKVSVFIWSHAKCFLIFCMSFKI